MIRISLQSQRLSVLLLMPLVALQRGEYLMVQGTALHQQHRHRYLQDLLSMTEDNTEETCQLVDANRLAQYLAGQETFVQSLFPSSSSSNQQRWLQQQPEQQDDNSSSTPTNNATVIAASNLNVFRKSEQDLTIQLQIDGDSSSRRRVLRHVSAICISKGGDFDRWGASIDLTNTVVLRKLQEEAGSTAEEGELLQQQILERLEEIGFAITPISSILVPDDQPFVGVLISTQQRQFANLILWVDETVDAAWQQYQLEQRVERETRMQEQANSTLASSLANVKRCENKHATKAVRPCLRTARRNYSKEEKSLKKKSRKSQSYYEKKLKRLDKRRFQQLAAISMYCAYLVDPPLNEGGWSLQELQACILNRRDSLYRGYLIDYADFSSNIRVEKSLLESRLSTARVERSEQVRDCCADAEIDKDDNGERLLVRSVQSSSPLSRVTFQVPRYANVVALPFGRALQTLENSCTASAFIADDATIMETVDFPEELYRSLTASAGSNSGSDSTSSVPADIYKATGYDTASTAPQQTVELEKAGITLEVTSYKLGVDLQAVANDPNTSRRVARFIQSSKFESTVVEATSMEAGVEVVAILFTRARSQEQQLFWPIEDVSGFLLEEEEETRRRMRRDKETAEKSAHRQRQIRLPEPGTSSPASIRAFYDFLETEEGEAAIVQVLQERFCDAPDVSSIRELDLRCARKLLKTATKEEDFAQIDAIFSRDDVNNLILELEEMRLRDYVEAGAACAQEVAAANGNGDLDDWNPSDVFQCLQEEKSPLIAAKYLYELQAFLDEAILYLFQLDKELNSILLEIYDVFERQCCVTVAAGFPSSTP